MASAWLWRMANCLGQISCLSKEMILRTLTKCQGFAVDETAKPLSRPSVPILPAQHSRAFDHSEAFGTRTLGLIPRGNVEPLPLTN